METPDDLTIPFKVHVAVLGYEVDRIVEPLKRRGVSRFYLVIGETESERGKQFIEILKKKIVGTEKEKALIPSDEFKQVSANLWDYRDLVAKICEIINFEGKQGHNVYVNVSSGSKLAAVASTNASFMCCAKPYYVQVEEHNYEKILELQGKNPQGLTSGVKSIIDIPETGTVKRPKDEFVKALSIVNTKPGLSQKELMDALDKEGLLPREEGENGVYIKFRRKYLEPLLDRKWVSTKKEGKESMVSLTDNGMNILRTFEGVSKNKKPKTL
jgi:hypothetical protein